MEFVQFQMIKRKHMQVSESFDDWYKKMRLENLKQNGTDLSARELTERICKSPELLDIEKRILNKRLETDSINFKIKFDRRIL